MHRTEFVSGSELERESDNNPGRGGGCSLILGVQGYSVQQGLGFLVRTLELASFLDFRTGYHFCLKTLKTNPHNMEKSCNLSEIYMKRTW